jgi:hypothetical protein
MAKQHFLEVLPFIATIAVLALLATVALRIQRRDSDNSYRGASSAERFEGDLDQASMETLWADTMWKLNDR